MARGRSLALALLLALLGVAPARAEDPCVPPPDAGALASAALGESGLGGTGLSSGESGVGGTGLGGDDSGVGGTGIFGTITAFGSICVNGLRIHYDAGVPIERNGMEARVSELAVGQVVFVRAHRRAGRLEARSIAIHSALIGAVTRVDPIRREIEVLGRTVEVPGQAILTGVEGSLAGLRGRAVDVSGLFRADDLVVASRLVVLPDGPVSERVGPDVGQLVRRAGGLERLSVEGYLRGSPARPSIGDLPVALAAGGRAPLAVGARVRASGRLDRDGALRVELPARPLRGPTWRPPPSDPSASSDRSARRASTGPSAPCAPSAWTCRASA